MKITTKQNGQIEITPEQYSVVSWYATILRCAEITGEERTEKTRWQLWGLRSAGECINVPWEVFYDISINKNYSEYRNMNRLTENIRLTSN